jgi:serine/threonine protein kinase
MIGEVISDKYKVVAAISESHMYEVFKALEVATGATVVVKILKEEMAVNAERIKNFTEEVRSFASISHHLVAEILDIDMFEDRPYVVTELVDGKDLHNWIRGEVLPFETAAKILQDLATVLQFASDQGVLQRTIKLSNVLRNKDGKLKVLSFTHPRLKLAGRMKNSENSGIHSDLFFLGTTFFEMLAGESPIRKRGGINELWDMKLETHLRIRHSALRPDQIDKVVSFVRKTLTRDMKNRFNSHEEFLKALADLSSGVRGSSIRQKTRQLSMASQVVDALNGRMSNVNTSMPERTFKKASAVAPSVMQVTNSLTEDRTETAEQNMQATEIVEGNLAVAPAPLENQFENTAPENKAAKKTGLKVVKLPERERTTNQKTTTWNDEEDSHWLRNPVLFMGTCLVMMVFLIIFW